MEAAEAGPEAQAPGGEGTAQPGGVLLAALRWAWEGTYLITEPGDGLLVIRCGDGGSFAASDPVEARDAILADYARKPAWPPRDVGSLDRRLAFERANPGVRWLAPSTLHRAVWLEDGKWRDESSPSADGLLGRLRNRLERGEPS